MRRTTTALLMVWTMMVTGCGEERQENGFLARDSSGIQLVESHRSAWEGGGGWEVGGEALLRLGVVEGEAPYQFNGVTGLARLGDGTIAVADGGSQQIRLFGTGGAVTTVFGGEGEGPGEFVGLSGMGVGPGGLIWAYDFMLRRITWVDASGEMVRLVSLGSQPPMLNPVGALPDGSFLLKQLWAATAVAEASEMGLRRDPVALVRFDGDGALMDTLAVVPGREVFLSQEDGRGVMGTPPFGRNAVATLWGPGVAVGDQTEFQVVQYAPTGQPVMIARIPGWEGSLRPGDLEEYLQARLARVPEERRAEARKNMVAMPVPDSRPAFGGILGDRAGNLWLAEWVMPPDTPESWTVLDSAGRWLGEVGMPPRFFPWSIGEDWVLGVEWDEMDVEYVVVYPLEREVNQSG